jgi:hypothetical protein
MKPTMSLAWKEWHEVRAFLWIGLGVFLGLPLIGGLEERFTQFHHFHIATAGWVVAFGGVLAVFVAVGATCRDFTGHLEDFWRSRPIGPMRWLLIKYIAGLTVVLTACIVPLIVQWAVARDSITQELILLYPFFWTAVYSVAFLAGCLIRRTAQAAMIALAGMLMLSFLPMILPPLRVFDVAGLIDGAGGYRLPARQYHCIAALLVLSLALLTISLLAVHRSWRIESGKKMMYGSVASAILILFASAAFQLGTNLPVLLEAPLPAGENVVDFASDASGTFVSTQRDVGKENEAPFKFPSRSIELTPSAIKLGKPTNSDAWFGYVNNSYMVSAPNDLSVRYLLNGSFWNFNTISLYIMRTRRGPAREVLQLWTQSKEVSSPALYAVQNRLYAIGSRLVTMDITQPLQPRVISDIPFGYSFLSETLPPMSDHLVVPVPPVSALTREDRLNVALKRIWQSVFDGHTLCGWSGEVLAEYRLSDLTDKSATFVKVGQYEPTMLERVFGSYRFGAIRLANGLLYVSEGGGFGQTFNAYITVFDTNGPTPMRPIAHFAAPNTWGLTVLPLPNGRALIGGNKIWLVGPPPGNYNSGR